MLIMWLCLGFTNSDDVSYLLTKRAQLWCGPQSKSPRRKRSNDRHEVTLVALSAFVDGCERGKVFGHSVSSFVLIFLQFSTNSRLDREQHCEGTAGAGDAFNLHMPAVALDDSGDD